jgi:hypothetical protein
MDYPHSRKKKKGKKKGKYEISKLNETLTSMNLTNILYSSCKIHVLLSSPWNFLQKISYF